MTHALGKSQNLEGEKESDVVIRTGLGDDSGVEIWITVRETKMHPRHNELRTDENGEILEFKKY